MKRALFATLWIGAIAGGLAVALQLSGLLARPSFALARAIGYSPNDPPGFANFLLVLLLAFAVAWAMLQVTESARRFIILLLILAELAGAAWVLHLYQIIFPPLPAAIAVVSATLLAIVVTARTNVVIAQNARADAAEQDRTSDREESLATAELIRAVFTARSQDDTRAAYLIYAKRLDEITAQRAETERQRQSAPLPAPPSQTCG